MPYVIDLTGEEYPLKATITNDGEVNGNQILSATIEFNDVNKAFIRNIAELWRIVDHNDVEHVIKYCRRRGVGDKMAVDVKGVPVFFDKLDNDRIYDRIDKHMTANEAFTRIFEDTGFTFVLVDSFAAVDWEGFGDGETKLESFKRALERYKCEFEITGNTVYLRRQIGRDTNIMYRHKLNASNIVQEIDANELWTFARGYGDYGDGEGGEDWRDAKLIREYTSPLASILGIRHAPPIKNGNIKDPAFMDAQLKTLVDESLKISVSATIHDLRKQGYPYAQSQLGDRVFLIDERIGLNEEVRVVAQSITRDWKGDVVDAKITFGNVGVAKRYQSNLQTAVKNITGIIEGRGQLPYNALPNAIKAATEALLSAKTELKFEKGIIAIDPSNPNNLVIFNSAGIGVSRDGGQTFENAITYLGVNTNLLTAGDIHTNNIRILGDADYFYWDGTGLHAIDPNDANRFVKLTSSGLYISKGALTIERPDGYQSVIDGIIQNDYNLQFYRPQWYNAPTVQSYQWMVNESQTYGDFDAFNYKHVSRYLHLGFIVKVDDPSAQATIRVRDEYDGSYVAWASSSSTEGETVGMVIDMGTPTGRRNAYRLQLRTSVPGVRAHVRLIQAYGEG